MVFVASVGAQRTAARALPRNSHPAAPAATTLGGSILFTENCGHGLPALAETSIQWLGTSKIALIPVRGMSGMVPGMVPNEIQSK